MRRILLFTIALLLSVQAQATDFKRIPIGRMFNVTGSNFTNFSLDGATDSIEAIMQVDEATTLTTAIFRYGVRTGVPPVYRISIQGVTNAGRADGTIKGGGTVFGTFTPPSDTSWNSTIRRITLGASYAATRGEFISIVIDYSSAPIDGSNFSSISTFSSSTEDSIFPYVVENNAGTPTRRSGHPLLAVASATATYGFPLENATSTTYSSGSTPDEYGLAFTLDSGYGSSFQVGCVGGYFRAAAAGKTYDIVLYSNATVLQTMTFDTDMLSTNAVLDRRITLCWPDTTLATLSFGTQYIIAIKPNETDTANGIRVLEFNAAQDLSTVAGGTDFHLATRSDAGAWTLDTTKRPTMWPIVKDWTEPSGGGGTTWRGIIGG
jgi:hypothetical protein